MPALRVGRDRQGREGRQRDPEIRVPRLWQALRPPHRYDLRFQEDTDIGMDRIPPPPFRIPFAEDLRDGQQEFGNHRWILAFQGVRGPEGDPAGHRPEGERLRGREALRRPKRGQGKGQGPDRFVPCEGMPVLRRHRHRRRKRHIPRHGQIEAERQGLHEDLRETHRRGIRAHPRRRAEPQLLHRRPCAEKQGPYLSGDERPKGRGEPDGPHKRRPRQNGEIHGRPSGLRQVAAAGLDEPVLVHLVHARRQDG